MTRDQMIADLLARRQAKLDELNELVSKGAPDPQKEAVADEINRLSGEMEKLGHNDA